MKMTISKKIHKFIEQGGWIRKMFESGIILKQQYGSDNVFDLSLGNPVIEPPAEFHEALLKLASNPIPGMHRYCLLYTSPSPRDATLSRMPSSA